MALLDARNESLIPKHLNTPYLETYMFNELANDFQLRSHSTGFLIWQNEPNLITNWHVVTGIDPEAPTSQPLGKNPPLFIKMFIVGAGSTYYQLSIPLYDEHQRPRWIEFEEGSVIDLIMIPLPKNLIEYVDIPVFEITQHNSREIVLELGRTVFIPGYPFSREDIAKHFGPKAAFPIPIWKKASIATNPDDPINDHVVLLDGLSRPGMSGSPVYAAQEEEFYLIPNDKPIGTARHKWINKSGLKRTIQSQALRFMGIYSGTIGKSMSDLALGKCWNVYAFMKLFSHGRWGVMKDQKPNVPSIYENMFDYKDLQLVEIDSEGREKTQIPLSATDQ